MAQTPAELPPFGEQYASLVKSAFAEAVARDRAAGADLLAQARTYAERGKPEFVLAYLMDLEMDDTAKRDLLARAFEERADSMERQAVELEALHSRPFPLIGIEARKDRGMARAVRQGKMIRPYARASKPLTMQ